MKSYFVYIMASDSGTLYLGVTNNLTRRAYEHRNSLVESFSSKYGCKKLVYFETTNSIESAILREKQIKKWRREKKENLIRSLNPKWLDLYKDII
jgi:putative endonuclease